MIHIRHQHQNHPKPDKGNNPIQRIQKRQVVNKHLENRTAKEDHRGNTYDLSTLPHAQGHNNHRVHKPNARHRQLPHIIEGVQMITCSRLYL